jgi:serine protein kinase
MKLLNKYIEKFSFNVVENLSLIDYLKKAKSNKNYYTTAAERMVKAIGEPSYIDTAKSSKLQKIFGSKRLPVYEVFKDFYGMEETLHKIVGFFKHASQDLEESKQILYLLGPVGSAKSSIAERLKKLISKELIYVLAVQDAEGKLTLSPVNESPLGLLDEEDCEELGIPRQYLQIKPSPWAIKRCDDFSGDVSQFRVVGVYPNQFKQLAITKTEPGDENNQDISTLVGKLDIRKLEHYAQDDADAYSYSGGLCKGNQGMLEFVEMFKAPIKVLHPLLTATQEHNYKGTEAISDIPFNGIIVSHSNESEWEKFKNNKNNEAFLDRVYVVEVPYCTRISEEMNIYKKYIEGSKLSKSPCAPGTLEMLAKFAILTRLDDPENSSLYAKLLTYNGDEVRDRYAQTKSVPEYREQASHKEAFTGCSTRTAFKILAEVFNYDDSEIAADPVHLLVVIEDYINTSRLSEEEETKQLAFLREYLSPEYMKLLSDEIQTAYLESYDEFGQSLFNRYILYADHWTQDNDFRDPDTGQIWERNDLNAELEKIEKAAGIANPKDFRNEVVNFALRYRASHGGKDLSWTADPKMKRVVKANMYNKIEDLLPIISFDAKKDSDDKNKHASFISRMQDLGYTEKQVRRLVEWYVRYKKTV